MTNNLKTYGEILALMQGRYRELTGIAPDDASDIGVRLKVLAEQVSSLYEQAAELALQMFPQTSSGRYLELHAQTRGITRKGAAPSTGFLRFKREVPSVQDIPIPAGIVCATRSDPAGRFGPAGQLGPAIRFETVEAGLLPAGALQADVPCRAMEGGAAGNVAAGSVTAFVTAPAGISGVENPVPCFGGVDGEEDESLRARLLESYRNISNGTNRVFYYDLALSHEGVESVNVLPRKRGRGTVDVVVACAGDDSAIVSALQTELDIKKEVNVDVLVRQAETFPLDVPVEIGTAGGNSFEPVRDAVAQAVGEYLSRLAVGQPLYLARLSAALLAVEGVGNVKLGLPGDVTPGDGKVIRPGTVTVTPMVTG